MVLKFLNPPKILCFFLTRIEAGFSQNWLEFQEYLKFESFLRYKAKTLVIAGIFPSTFLQSVNASKNSILNWVTKITKSHSVHPPFCWGRGGGVGRVVEPLTKFSKEGGLNVSIFWKSGDLNFKTFSFAAHPGETFGDSELSKL